MGYLQSISTWFFTLPPEGQASIVSSVIAAIAAIFVAVAATVIAHGISARASLRQVKAVGLQKVAEFRISWIEDLRSSVVKLSRYQYELNLLLRKMGPLTPEERRRKRDIWLDIAAIKADIRLRIKPSSEEDDEIKLLSVLKKSVSRNRLQAQQDRSVIIRLSQSILSAEWTKLKSELSTLKRK